MTTESTEVKIVVADDHAVMRDGLRMVLDAQPGFSVVAEAGDLDTTLRMVRAHRPHVLLLDINLAGTMSLASIPELRESTPETRIVVLTMQDDPGFAEAAFQAGAVGYVLKESASEELLKAIRAALDGGTYLQPELGAKIAADKSRKEPDDDGLTDREREVLTLVALGHTNPEIASQLYLSVRTVESHRAHIQQKLRTSTRSELVRYALDHGLLKAG
ncbi:MAG: two-component system, NarL family, response regulator NreC [Thermoleophilaceae bacterium]|jgi:two-component system response regulator NreC|nr:two-component system, NarL family, response regulator NreC [Thermoleophilaceae bacterium]